MPRLRQAVLAANDLDAKVESLRTALGLREPFSDPAVAYFGLKNAVFAIGDQFLEVVSPVQPDTSAGRLLARRGGDCGYMAMFQVESVADARTRAGELGVREIFDVRFDDIVEAHLHPGDMRGAIVSVSEPEPAEAWRWGGPDWRARSVPGRIASLTVAVSDPEATRERWSTVIGATPEVEFAADECERGITEIRIERDDQVVTISP